MRKLLKIIGIILLILIGIYLISIPILRKKNAIPESVFFTPTPYIKEKIITHIQSTRFSYISADSLLHIANKFISSTNKDSVTINGTAIIRDFKKLDNSTNAEYFIFKPQKIEKSGIFMMGNGFNIFKLIDNLSELAKRNNTIIYVLNYNNYGHSTGLPDGFSQLKNNQEFYNFVNSTQKIDFIAGHSLGTAFSTKLAVDNKIPHLILLAGASNVNDLVQHFKNQMNIFVRPYVNVDKLNHSGIAQIANSAENIKHYYGNLLLIHGTGDSNLPYAMAEKLFKNCPSTNKE